MLDSCLDSAALLLEAGDFLAGVLLVLAVCCPEDGHCFLCFALDGLYSSSMSGRKVSHSFLGSSDAGYRFCLLFFHLFQPDLS